MIDVRDLTIARGGVPVAEGLSFSVAAGEAVVLRGPNGIGKTTLLRTLAGLQPALSGSIDISSDQVAYSGHADGVKATLTVAENLRFWAQIFGGSDIAPAMSAFDLTGLFDRAAMHLSAGQRRRLGLARMLVTGRSLWLMDEPTVSLDAASVGLFATAVEDHCAAGGAVVLATHIDLGLQRARVIDLAPYKAKPTETEFDEAFL